MRTSKSLTTGALLWALLLAGCRAVTPAPETPATLPTPPASAPVPQAVELPNDVRWSRDSAEHKAILVQVYHMAGEVLAPMAAELEPGTWAVALDADETVIDNSLYQKERIEIGETYSSESWAQWVARKEAPPLPGALGFLGRVRALGGKIAIVTNRKEDHCPDTRANFHAFSIPFDVILCKPPGEDRKEVRWEKVENGTAAEGLPPLDIVMWLGDNIQDFPRLDQELRRQPEAAFERFGLQYFVLPNPMYGSWEDNPGE